MLVLFKLYNVLEKKKKLPALPCDVIATLSSSTYWF